MEASLALTKTIRPFELKFLNENRWNQLDLQNNYLSLTGSQSIRRRNLLMLKRLGRPLVSKKRKSGSRSLNPKNKRGMRKKKQEDRMNHRIPIRMTPVMNLTMTVTQIQRVTLICKTKCCIYFITMNFFEHLFCIIA